jgi:predicted transcriptional regulator
MKKKKITRLTKAEEQVMQILWDLDESIIKDMVSQFEEPKPAYTTVATVLRVLEKKEFVGRKKIANTHIYFPIISKTDYTKYQMTNLLKNYFNGSFPKMATFFAKENNISLTDLESILRDVQTEINNSKLTDNE